MILQESLLIAAPPAAAFDFFRQMDSNYRRWHPDHVSFEWLDDTRLAVGSRFRFEERINGKPIRRTDRMNRIVEDRLVEFQPQNALFRLFLRSVSFAMEPEGAGGCRLTQTITLRIGPLGRWLNRRDFAAVERHMREEGWNLKALLERPAALPSL